MDKLDSKLIEAAEVNQKEVLNKAMLQLRRFDSTTLFAKAKSILILHMGEKYLLTITKQKKLLLTKL